MILRESCIQDLPYIYDICLKTGNSGKDATESFYDKNMLGSYYAAPYVVHSPEDCFVIVESGLVSGYILSTKDTNGFYTWLNNKWLPNIRENYKENFEAKTEREKSLLNTIMKDTEMEKSLWIKEFPAHLHIDILANLQGKGAGKALMQRLFEHLKKNSVPGVHLGVDGANENAIGFYKKIGFEVLENKDWGFILGYDLTK